MVIPVATPTAKVVVKSFIQKVGGRPVGQIAALVVAALGGHDHERQTDADGHEDEVITDGEGELDAGEQQGVHACTAPPWQATGRAIFTEMGQCQRNCRCRNPGRESIREMNKQY